MLVAYGIAMIGVAALAAGWLAVQLAWNKRFPGDGSEPDGLARRGGCNGCAHREACMPYDSSEEDGR